MNINITKGLTAALLLTAACVINSCKEDEVVLERDKFIGSYDYVRYATIYFGTTVVQDTSDGIFFIEVPEASLGLGDNYIAIKSMHCNSECTAYASVSGNDFLLEGSINEQNLSGTGTTSNGGETLDIEYEYGGISGTIATVTATKR